MASTPLPVPGDRTRQRCPRRKGRRTARRRALTTDTAASVVDVATDATEHLRRPTDSTARSCRGDDLRGSSGAFDFGRCRDRTAARDTADAVLD
jgi:hypothetical protein